MRIVLDAMGGDHAPSAVVEGALRAAGEWPDTEFLLLGVEDVLQEEGPANLRFRRVSESIDPGEEPVKAVRRKRDSSIVVGCRMVREGEADAFISAGNTGALMTAGLLMTGRLPGIDRPALAPVFPTINGDGVLVLDVGANPEAKPQHLEQYALMGHIVAEKVMGIFKPRIGLLNNGTEAGKGTALTKAAYEHLGKLPIHFIGNVEARDALYGICDVLVCDGFSGNILLKTTEGVAKAIFDRLKEEFTRTTVNKLAAAVLKPGLKRFAQSMDYKEHGGAPLLGLRGPVIKAHGSSDARAIFNAVGQAHMFVTHDVINQISDKLGNLERD
ncbi:phosphate acyltransferase PlsX [Kroppenstedtia pulmonis]|uniref:Phosphate acyltransferase n=1 Tax=Kroppenstedtia pulmonis TaxID=1380685 RepID=A0A7D4BHK6_9BACL|nr:phosphate acyltransferase PlsX [Kroppenstedtia pulmonis]QKG84655.1 phosphate acyltransferase PlsX [Kroppenstedtia pulmonis]